VATPRKPHDEPSDLLDALKADFHAHGVSALALAMADNEHTLRSYASDQLSGGTLRRIASMIGHLSRGGCTETVRLLCRMCGGTFAEDGDGPITKANALTWVATMMRETGDANAAVAEAFADGRITQREAVKVIREIDEAVATMRRVKAAVVKAAGDAGEEAR
jgi:hypothetical protein